MTTPTAIADTRPPESRECDVVASAEHMLRALAKSDRQAAEDVRSMLAATLTFTPSREELERNLGLLTSLVSSLHGEIPQTRDYQALREQRRHLSGETWPDATTLINHHGTWIRAVSTAMKLAFRSSPRVRADGKSTPPPSRRSYTRGEILAAIIDCARFYEHWPTSTEYADWAHLRHALHKRSGRGGTIPVPTLKPLRRQYGTFEKAIEATKRDLTLSTPEDSPTS